MMDFAVRYLVLFLLLAGLLGLGAWLLLVWLWATFCEAVGEFLQAESE